MLKPLMSHAEVGRRMGLSKTQVQRLDKSALAKIRDHLTKSLGPDFFEGRADGAPEEPPK